MNHSLDILNSSVPIDGTYLVEGTLPQKTIIGMVQVNNSFSEQSYLPLSVAFLEAYAKKYVRNINNFEFTVPIYKRISVQNALKQLEGASLVAFSVYVWNFRISCLIAQELKKTDPDITILFGGCHVPDDDKVLEEFLKDLPYVDFAIRGEGEIAFASFLENYHTKNWNKVSSLAYVDNGHFVKTPVASRIEDLNDVPSPFLNGIFDDLIAANPNEGWIGLWETNRGCPFKCTYCFSGDTMLLLKDRIARFNQEEYVEKKFASEGYDHRKKVGIHDESFVYQGMKNCIKIEFSNGTYLTLTPDHELFCIENDNILTKKAGKLLVGDWAPVQTGQNSISKKIKISVDNISSRMLGKVPDVLDEDLAWMTGLLIGDGNIRKNRGSVRFVASPEIEAKIVALSEKVFCIKAHSYSTGNTDKVKHVELISRLVVKTFESLGVLQGKDKLRVPNSILKSPANVVRAFLDGLWDADGYIPKTVAPPYLTTVSHRLAEEVCSLIYWIGDVAQIRKIDSKKYKPNVSYNVQPVYRVAWHSKDMREKDNLRGPCGIANQIPLTFCITHDLKPVQGIGTNGRTRGVVSRNRLRRFDKKHPLLADNLVFTQIKSITPVGKLEVYDIMDQPNSQVAANGILAHNCDWGVGSKKRMADYNLDRLFNEIDWFSKNKIEFIYCCDANFGMYKDRDLSITKKFVENKKLHGYPEALSVQNTKNSTEASYNIQKVMTQNGLSKGVLLAFQTLNEDTLKAIKRDNIKLETYYELQRRFTSEGVETFSDMILGLPEETYETFIEGISVLIEKGQHNRIQFSNLSILPNAEMGDKEYQKKYGLELVETKQINTHGSLGEWLDNIYETQQLVVSTSSMSREDWVRCRSFAFMMALVHFDKLLQIPSILAYVNFGIRYRDFVEAMMQSSSPVISRAKEFFVDKAKDIQSGGAEYCESSEWLGIFWPADEFFFIKLITENLLEDFYKESMDIFVKLLKDRGHEESEFKQVMQEAMHFNEKLIKIPFVDTDIDVKLNFNIWDVYRASLIGENIKLERGDYLYTIDRSSNCWKAWDDWLRKVVWYGNKKGAYLYRCN